MKMGDKKKRMIKAMISPSLGGSDLVQKLGRESNTYVRSLKLLEIAWDEMDSEVKKQISSIWNDLQKRLYGQTQSQIFYTYTYLAWIVRTIKSEIFRIPVERNVQDDIFSWIWETPHIAELFIERLRKTVKILDLGNIQRDIFKDLYEELVGKDLRVRRGEYNTPDWLAELILERTLRMHGKLVPPKIIDPACGTGTFIFHAIRQLRKRFTLTKAVNVVGIDINPLMVEIAKTNYLFALGKDQLVFDDDSHIPVFCLNSLKLSKKTVNMLGEFDIVIGNPPWGSLRDIKSPDYREFIKKLSIDAGLIEKKDKHLYTQIEVSTVFFVKCMHFLKQAGTLAFVMPRSTIGSAMQNYNFTRDKRVGLHFVEILDLEGVKPLFNMPTCVVMCDKDGAQTYPIRMIKYRATLPRASHTLTETMPYLVSEETQYTPVFLTPKNRSYYYDLFKVGVCIFPRSLYFITPIQMHEGLIEVRTSDEILAKYTKEPWKTALSGLIKPEFIYCTLLGWEVMPYFFASLRLVVLPVEKKNDNFHLINIQDMYKKAGLEVAKWFEKAEKIWRERRTVSSEKLFPSIVDRFNYGDLLDSQSPKRRFIVAYNATGKYLTSCIVDRHKLPPVGNGLLTPVDFVADVKTWIYETNNYDEALYLCGVLNSDVIDERIKPFQPTGLGGPRAIHRRPLMLNIPKFNISNRIHLKIAELASVNAKSVIQKRPSSTRRRIKERLPVNDEIDSLVEKLLRG